MSSNPFLKLVAPRYPSAAASIERGKIVVVQLDKSREGFAMKRGAAVTFRDDLVNPGFSAESNISNLDELAAAISDAALSAGLGKQQKWSVALPEGSTRTIILTLESTPSSSSELEEILLWKVERGFGYPVEELQISREKLLPDPQGRTRYLATALRKSVLAEFETVFESLGWKAGLILPRSAAEARWLTGNALEGDSLLLSSHDQGFTAAIYRQAQPLALRSILCDDDDRHDELFRFLLFYRDRLATGEDGEIRSQLARMLLAGKGFSENLVSEVITETLDSEVHVLSARDLGISVPSSDFSFDDLVAPAALASMAW
jgi:hypothetical protein